MRSAASTPMWCSSAAHGTGARARADPAVVDLVATGSTLRANGLVETEVIAKHYQPADRQSHRAENAAGADRCLDRAFPCAALAAG